MTELTNENFKKENFASSAGWISYPVNGENKFVARCRVASHAGSFMTFLRKNFTVSEYFAAYDSGITPLEILNSKGYISPNMKKVLKHNGFSADQAGLTLYNEDRA